MAAHIVVPAAFGGMVIVASAAGLAVAGEIEVIYTEVPGHPTALVPGAVGPTGMPIVTEFRAMEDMILGPDGTQWILKARNEAGSDIETMLLLGAGTTGSVFAQEGQPVHGGAPGEVYDFFDPMAGFNGAGDFAYGARARDGDPSVKEKVIVFDGTYTVVIQESDPALGLIDLPPNPSGDETFGNSLNSIHLLDDGTVGFVAVTISNIHSSRRPAIFYDDTAFAQAGVTPIGSSIWEGFDSNSFLTTPDCAHWLVRGNDLSIPFSSPNLLAVDGAVAIIEGSSVGGVLVADVFNAKLLSNGDWFARGDDPADDDWAVRNGTLVAATGDPITTGATEHWAARLLSFTGNRTGDWVLIGDTDAADIQTDSVIVLNGTDVVVREGDPVDLDGNGMFDDDAFIGRGNATLVAFNSNDVFLTDDRVLYFIAPLRDALGNDLATTGGGDAFLRLSLVDCPADINGDGTVNVFDLLEVLANWGVAGGGGPADLNGDGTVNVFDLLIVLADWGPC